ncbi:hypothetical protein RhiirA5_376557 [Rhizophagus irregularis]|uniref:Uncharacterized protein n=2 Tax=Rhizophagus irregularis TaxID=588596 RepID=U9TW99_RHIID|nr:hypothetical protein GLOIN_2v1783423 [Rhizophagus irregularis DAOM 181602=DAOM 197198]PKC08074.1 hypothetical protein RhiirA5_376557 [Rhizophagus irregularis]POG63950.1 hypothetical protein GLOIN_2v1783423 [Rhizophagus irregularis DAOM 181602=DAOM 197198]UZO18064.1 hypothetical protein OCT59_009385 [Rhizophagus irregularis]CAB5148015.1 unnamed protein product [Rhizophagus irregularis]CAG8597193.1 21207_t:CDS:1 [Rhizophagus irregularis]|eukprot:XP_025170816.1 hypothetical protein GLOIN_2v1783423 [Rhizophagus irregularis DAOM 181602=DAOM 197198]
MEIDHKPLEKRQASAMSDSICQLVLKGYQPTGQLLCCEAGNACLGNAPICSSTSRMVQCWNINQLGSCKRKDTLAKTVCQYQDGIYCLKGETDELYDRGKLAWSAIDLVLNRNIYSYSFNGFTMNYGNFPNPILNPNPKENLVCSDAMASGICQIQGDFGYKTFNYQVEVCNGLIDIINSPPKIAKAITTITEQVTTTLPPETITTTSTKLTTSILTPETKTTTVTAAAPISLGSSGLSNYSEISFLPLVILLVTILVNTIVMKLRI